MPLWHADRRSLNIQKMSHVPISLISFNEDRVKRGQEAEVKWEWSKTFKDWNLLLFTNYLTLVVWKRSIMEIRDCYSKEGKNHLKLWCCSINFEADLFLGTILIFGKKEFGMGLWLGIPWGCETVNLKGSLSHPKRRENHTHLPKRF